MTGRRTAELTPTEVAALEADLARQEARKARPKPRPLSKSAKLHRGREKARQARREAEIVLPGGWLLRPDLLDRTGRAESWKLEGPSQPPRYYAELETAIRAWSGNSAAWIREHRPRAKR